MKKIVVLLLFVMSGVYAQNNEAIKDIKAHQKEQNKEFKTKGKSPLTEADRKVFKELDFFDIDLKFRMEATFVRIENESPFKMKTSTDRLPEYVKYGELHFNLNNEKLQLNVYQNTKLIENPEYKDYLFIPFTDETNGETSYGGGRYVDFKIPASNKVILDFNKAYNPYCSYSSRYSCPIPPKENHLEIAINAGVKAYTKHH